MSRYDYRDPGTDPTYCNGLSATEFATCQVCGDTMLVDADDEGPFTCDRCEPLNPIRPDPPIDPAEHACHTIIEALSTLEKEIVTAADLARARTLRRMVRDLWQHVTDVTDRAANKEDELVERLR